jgi:hypothetical protein
VVRSVAQALKAMMAVMGNGTHQDTPEVAVVEQEQQVVAQ